MVGPAFATEDFGRDLAPHLHTGMTVVVCPGACGGALAFKRAAELAVRDEGILVGETSTLPYAARADGQGNVRVFQGFHEEGVTTSVGHVMEAVDNERLAIAAALGVSILSEPNLGVEQGYMTECNYSTGYSRAPGFLGIKAPDRIDSRYLTEDVWYTLVFFTDLARRLGVPTPTMDAIIEITSVVLARDLCAAAARTMSSLGLDQLTNEQLLNL